MCIAEGNLTQYSIWQSVIELKDKVNMIILKSGAFARQQQQKTATSSTRHKKKIFGFASKPSWTGAQTSSGSTTETVSDMSSSTKCETFWKIQ